MHLRLTLTPRVPGYPTGPWAPSKPYMKKKTKKNSSTFSKQQSKMHFCDYVSINIALCITCHGDDHVLTLMSYCAIKMMTLMENNGYHNYSVLLNIM